MPKLSPKKQVTLKDLVDSNKRDADILRQQNATAKRKEPPASTKPTLGKSKVLDVAKAIKAAVHVLVPEATLAETGMAMILAGLGEQLGMHIAHVVEDGLHDAPGLLHHVGAHE